MAGEIVNNIKYLVPIGACGRLSGLVLEGSVRMLILSNQDFGDTHLKMKIETH